MVCTSCTFLAITLIFLLIVLTFFSIYRDWWYSSPTYAAGFAVNHIINSAILFAGLGEFQFFRFCKFINLTHQSPTTFYCHQRLYAAPTVHQEYEVLEASLIEELKTSESVVLSGDGRMDSPGFSATKGTYSFMHNAWSAVITMGHGDKRQVFLVVLLLG